MQNIKVLIGIPVYQFCTLETMASVYGLKVPPGVTAELFFSRGYVVDRARNDIITHALKENFDYVLFVDSDVVLPQDTLKKLLSMNAAIISGWYVKKIPNQFVPEVFKNNDADMCENVKSMPENEIMEVDGCGFGCTLISIEVIKSLGSISWFEYHVGKGRILSEDLDFCIKAKQKGYKILVDSSIRCPHIGQVAF